MKINYFLPLILISMLSSAQIVNIPDPAFKNALVNTMCVVSIWGDLLDDVDTNNDGEIQVLEAAAVNRLKIDNQNIASLQGIEAFSSLFELNCSENNLSTLDLAQNETLAFIYCSHNQLTSLQLSETSDDHIAIDASNNLLTNVTIPPGNNYNLVDLSHNQLTQIQIEGAYVYDLKLDYNLFSELNLGFVANIHLSHCPITTCQLTANEAFIDNNPLLVSATFGSIGTFHVTDNPLLQSIDLKDGLVGLISADESSPDFYFHGNPSLEFVCVDDLGRWYEEEFFVTESDHVHVDPGVNVTYYCDLLPGGAYNMLNGTIYFDCGESNVALDNYDVNINLDQGSNGSIDASVNPGNEGQFVFYTSNAGSITPDLNTTYFTVSPPDFAYDFPSTGETQTVNFCVSANGVHPDAEISIIEITPARPGFDATYHVLLSNNGTESMSGAVTFTFDDSKLDFISANPATASQAENQLMWNFSNLMPFENRPIEVTLNVNSPMEIPAVNEGNILNFTALIDAGTDENPADNTFEFPQIVVGSFDPNDKTVSRQTIQISQLGDFLYYTVRFQNTGTFFAENVVIRDLISENLDFSTLEMVASSHPCRSLATSASFQIEQNKLEIFFENINLPASVDDEPASHGFAIYKIKPKSDLTIGNAIENTAEIYFDYNFPIVTNTVSTTVVPNLGIGDYDSSKITIHPNPAYDHFTISGDDEILSVKIFNQLGQMIRSISNQHISDPRIINISGLPSGTYFVKVSSASGTATKKLIKS